MTRLFDQGAPTEPQHPSRRGRDQRDVGGGEVGAGSVQARGMAPPAPSHAGDVDADLDHQLRVDECDGQGFPGAPSGGFSVKFYVLKSKRDAAALRAWLGERGRPSCHRTGRRNCCRLTEGVGGVGPGHR